MKRHTIRSFRSSVPCPFDYFGIVRGCGRFDSRFEGVRFAGEVASAFVFNLKIGAYVSVLCLYS